MCVVLIEVPEVRLIIERLAFLFDADTMVDEKPPLEKVGAVLEHYFKITEYDDFEVINILDNCLDVLDDIKTSRALNYYWINPVKAITVLGYSGNIAIQL